MSIFVNKIEITDAEVGQEMQYHPAQTQEAAWDLAAQSLVIRQLLLQQAANSGLCQDAGASIRPEQEEELIDLLLQQEVTVPEADEATCQRYYDNHPNGFKDAESGERLAFPNVQGLIREYLHTKAMRIAVAEYIKALSNSARIKGYDLC
jgi:hypothetical protein